MTSPWQIETTWITPDAVQSLRFRTMQRPLTRREVFRLLRVDETFRGLLTTTLASSPFAAFFWETPAVTATTLDVPFEFAVVSSPELAETAASPAAFADRFESAKPGETVLTFPNHGGDATLVVPCPTRPLRPWAHLAAFSRQAPEGLQQAFWQAVARALEARLGPQPVWLSTAGLGVPWLHVRLDDRPKYYRHAEYAVG
jgi:hypothetical protein